MAKKVTAVFFAILMLYGIMCIPAMAANPTPRISPYVVSENYVRLRTGPGTSYTALGQLQKGDQVMPEIDSDGIMKTAVDDNGTEWTYVYSYRHKKTGWVASEYIYDPQVTGRGARWYQSYITGGSVVVRADHSHTSKEVATLSDGTNVDPTFEYYDDPDTGEHWTQIYVPGVEVTGWVPSDRIANEGM